MKYHGRRLLISVRSDDTEEVSSKDEYESERVEKGYVSTHDADSR